MNRAKLTSQFDFIGDRLSVRPAFGVSTRQLTARYVGPCMTVRRSSDNAERDIYFACGVLDVGALRNFVAGGSCYVKTWYDQFGTSHPTQATTTAQPRIVNAGVLELTGNSKKRPAVRGGDTGLSAFLESATVPSGTTSMTEFTMNLVTTSIVSGPFVIFVLKQNTINLLAPYSGTAYFDFGGLSSPQRISATYPTPTGSASAVTAYNSTASNKKAILVNNGEIVNGTATTATANIVHLLSDIAGTGANSTVGEAMFMTATLAAADRLALFNSQAAFYGL